MSQSKAEDMLNETPAYRKFLFQRGFLITNTPPPEKLQTYPFYGNWFCKTLGDYTFIINKNVAFYHVKSGADDLFLIGHACNPFDAQTDETVILQKLANLDGKAFWQYESDLTGIYIMGRICHDGQLIHWSDCAGMRISYYGHVNGIYYVASHVNLVASLCHLTEDTYIKKLKAGRYFHLFGNALPADYSAYSELKRTVPNHAFSSAGHVERFFRLMK